MPGTVLAALYINSHKPSKREVFLFILCFAYEDAEALRGGRPGPQVVKVRVELGFLPRQAGFRSCALNHHTVCHNPLFLNTLFTFPKSWW